MSISLPKVQRLLYHVLLKVTNWLLKWASIIYLAIWFCLCTSFFNQNESMLLIQRIMEKQGFSVIYSLPIGYLTPCFGEAEAGVGLEEAFFCYHWTLIIVSLTHSNSVL